VRYPFASLPGLAKLLEAAPRLSEDERTMKLAIATTLLTSAAAFTPATKTATTSSRRSTALNVGFNNPSDALPFATAPDTLDGSLPGDAGFDPVGFSTAPFAGLFANGETDTMTDLQWLREAEITHGRIAQLAALGFFWPAFFGTFPGNDWTGADAFSYVNPVEAFEKAPTAAFTQIVIAAIFIEFRRVQIIKEEGSSRIPGDLKLGQTGFNPFNLDYSPEEYREKQVQEIKHCRLAMLGATGLWLQACNSGTDIATQLTTALQAPEYVAKAGYFLPEGI